MLLSVVPVKAATQYLVDIGFDNAVTNDQSEYIVVDGSSSARVVEDGKRNKSYTVECGNVDNIIKMFLPEYTASPQYVVQFDIRMQGKPTEGKITFSNASGASEDLITIDEKGRLKAKDSRIIGGINSNRMSTISIMVDTELKCLTLCCNGKSHYYRQDMGIAIPNISEIAILTYANKQNASLFIDNIRIYDGDRYINKNTVTPYNSELIDYEPEDESDLSDKVYYKNGLNSESALSMSKTAKRNKIEFVGEQDGGYVLLAKETTDDVFIDMTIGQTAKRVIVEADIRFKKNMPETLFYLRDSATSTQVNITPLTLKDDYINVQGSKKQLRKNVWYKMSIAINLAQHTYDVYIDGEAFVKGKGITTDFSTISTWRLYIGGNVMGSLDIDNLAVYGGSEPRNIDDAVVISKSRYSDTAAVGLLRGKKAIQLYGSTAFLNGTKQKTNKPVIIKNDIGLVDKDTFESFFGEKVSVSDKSISIGSKVKMTIGTDRITVNGKEYTIGAGPEMFDGVLYLPAREYGKYAQVKDFYDDEHGMILIGSKIDKSDARLKQANIYMYFDRKPAEELKSQFLENTDNGMKHPRLIADKTDFERLKNEVKNDPVKSEWYPKVISAADNILNASVLEYKINDGRLLDVSNAALSRLEYLGFAYQMTGDKKYSERGIKELEAVCAFPDWHTDHYLDTGTMASAVAIGYDWLYEAMTDEQRENIALKAQKHGLETAKLGYYASASYNDFWCDTETNWGIICNGGIVNLALATAEYNTDDVMDTMNNALRSIEIPWYRIAPDGAWYEGTGYWSYLLTHLTLFMSSYRSVMNEPFGESYMGMDKYAYFQAYFQDPDGLPNNFHDADEAMSENAGQFYMAKIYDDPSLMLYRINQMKQFNIQPCIFDLIWCKAGLDTENSSINLENAKYFRETEFVSMREDWNKEDSAWLSFHGGYSNTAHDHIDVGTFVYNIGGIRWAIDPGREMLSYSTYNPAVEAGYDPKLYYRRKGEGHNIVVINPNNSFEHDLSAFAQVYKPVSGAGGSYSKIDLSTAYAANVNSYTRGYLMTDNQRTLTVRDEINLKDNSVMHWFMHTKGEIRIVDNNTAIIYQDGKQLKMQFITNASDVKLTAMNAEGLETSPKFQNTENKGMSKIDYQLKNSGVTTITVKLSMIGEEGSKTGVSDVNIADWDLLINTAKETEAYEYGTKQLTGIYADGEMINGFAPDKYKYSVSRDINGKSPEISVNDSDNASIETYTKFNGSEVLVITVSDEKGNDTSYTVEIKEFDSTDISAVYNRHKLTAIAVSSEQIEEGINNVMSNSCDNDYETRWSANGIDEWCIYDLGEQKTIDAVAAALWMGNQRQFSFDVEVSDDGKNFTKVQSVVTDGRTEDAVVYKLEKSVKARYIKYAGHGSTANEWNNVIEFMALQNK
jgi:hypothetical protein